MASGVSPTNAPPSPTLLLQGQIAAHEQQRLPVAALYDPNNESTDLGMRGEGFAGLQRRPTEQWTGIPISDSSSASSCPDCLNRQTRIMWNGLNVYMPPWPNRPNGDEITTYGKTPKNYFQDFGKVDYYTLVLRSCAACQKWWYHYLFHTFTQDGRAPIQPVERMLEPQSLTPPPLTQCRSTPGRVSGGITQPSWSPSPTLVAESSPAYPKPHRNSTGNRQVVIHQDKSSSTQRAPPASVRASAAPSDALPSLVTGQEVGSSLSFLRQRPASNPVLSNTNRAHPALNVRTDFSPAASANTQSLDYGQAQTPWSQVNSRTMSPALPGVTPLAPSPMPHSPCAFSPAVPTPSAFSAISPADRFPSPAGVSPIRRAPTRPLSPPPKKVQRDPETYNEMRKQLACDDCRRRKKRCHPDHTGIRRPWPQRLDKKDKGPASVGERSASGSPSETPELGGGQW